MTNSATTYLTARVRVYSPIPEGMPWWRADIDGVSELIETYDCLPIGPEDPSVPHAAHLSMIRNNHLGCVLVHV